MAITDINISEELITNAPSIRYTGDEGPKSPQEEQMMMMASVDDPFYRPEYADDHAMEMFGKPYKDLNADELEEFMEEMRRLMNKFSGGNPLPEDPTKPVNPFQPKPIGPLPDKRQMAAFGGIMGMDGRRQYGLGSSLKKRLRKIIPNEVAEIAVKAAPFVAPFNPLAAGLMSGIGSFDQTGRIGSSLKSGLLNYGLGQGARYLGGADLQKGLNLRIGDGKGLSSYFSKPTGTNKRFFDDMFKSQSATSTGNAADSLSKEELLKSGKEYFESPALQFKYPKGVTEYQNFIASQKAPNLNFLDKALQFAKDNPLLTAAGIYGTAKALTPDETVSAIMDRGEGMDVASIRAEVQEAFQDETGAKLKALRVKYPFLGRADTKDLSAMADGGRIGFSSGSSLARLLAGKKITGSSRTFLEKVFGKEKFKEMATRDPEMHRGMLEVVEMFRSRDKEGLKMYLQKFLPHMDDEMIEDFIVGGGGTEGIQGQLIRLGSGRDYAGKLEMMKKADNMRKLDALDVDKMKPNAYGGRIRKQEGGLMDLGGMEKDYRAEGGFVPIGKAEKADDVPARLSVNEFVFTADAVRNAGGGDIDKGAEIMENMMKHLEQGGQVSDESQGMAGAQQMFEVSERLSEVI